jgi:hypothetical protein
MTSVSPPERSDSIDAELLRVINGSGFPLQIALQNAVETAAPGWKVSHREHAWSNPSSGQSGFIDFVVRSDETSDSVVVECKRVQNASWLFLGHTGSPKPTEVFNTWATVFPEARPPYFGWVDLRVPLSSPEAQFCCIRGQSSNDKNTFLEKIAAELVASTEALATEEREYRNDGRESCRLYFNVIVTTASLYFAEFSKESLNLEDGTVENAKFHKVPYVRVRKQFSMQVKPLTQEDFHSRYDPDIRRENSIFVVEAVHFIKFLQELKVENINVRAIGA